LLLLLLRRGLRRRTAAALVALRASLRARRVLGARAVVAIAVTLPSALRLLRAGVRAGRASAAGAPLASGALLELLHLALHELARLRLQTIAERVVPAIRAALPTLGIGFFAGGTEDAFGQRHRGSRGALYTSGPWTTGAKPCRH
jgi:hypothetical protein